MLFMSDKSEKEPGNSVIKYFIGGTIILIGLMVIFGFVTHCAFKVNLPAQGQFGDQFGALNSLFSGLAFLGLILTIIFQSRDLQTQTRALEMQITEFQEQKKEMERSAKAQELANEIALRGFAVDSINQQLGVTKLLYQEAAPGSHSRQRHFKEMENLLDELKILTK
jgi:hypothetical protein